MHSTTQVLLAPRARLKDLAASTGARSLPPPKAIPTNGNSRLSGVKPVAVDYTSTPITGTISKVLIAIDKTLPI